jgi:hypothetical protein
MQVIDHDLHEQFRSGFTDPASANQVTVRVAWPANAPAANQTYRDYVRIISKY